MRLICFFIFLSQFVPKINCKINNVCEHYDDYYTFRNNSNCWYDIAANANVTEVIKYYGYPLEIYKITTSDGYILSLYRIPNDDAPKKRNPVFLQAGLLSTAANFLGKRRESLAFLLSDAGYDVWLGNYRGTEYSEGHVNLTVFDKRYWDYSYDEIGLIDIPAMLQVIQAETGNKGDIVYIGHSLGTTIGLAYASSFPEEAKRIIKLLVLIAPAAPLTNMISPLRLLTPFADTILSVIQNNDLIRVTSQAEPLKRITKLICLESPILMKRCLQAVNLFYGPLHQMPPNTVPVFFNQFPAGTSLKVVKHAADMVLDHFGKYNYGWQNMARYGTFLPPIYNVSVIEVPTFIMYAVNDWACTKRDALNLFDRLSPSAKIHGIFEVKVKNFNHIDFLFGRNVKSIVYDRLLNLLEHL